MNSEVFHWFRVRIMKPFFVKKLYYFLVEKIGLFISDLNFLRVVYFLRTRKFLNVKNPVTFNEKLQWLKLYNRNPILSKLADKYKVRDFVAKKVGSDILIPLIGVYDSFDDIDFDKLPDKFILKCNHASGWNFVCEDKGRLDYKKMKKLFDFWLKTNYYYHGRSWEYKNIKPKIVCEKFLSQEGTFGLDDYKFHCFNGRPVYIQYIKNRLKGRTKETYYNTKWKFQPFNMTNCRNTKLVDRPKNLKKMLDISKKLSKGLPYARIDLYNLDGRIYFGEVTLCPANGMDNFDPPKYEKIFGDMIDINS